MDYFLKEMSKIYFLILFTASEKDYAEQILDIIDYEDQYFSMKFFRPMCLQTKNKVREMGNSISRKLLRI